MYIDTKKVLIKAALILGALSSSAMFGATMSYSFTSAEIVAAFSSNAYSGNSGTSYAGDGWLGSYSNNTTVNQFGNNRPAKYNGSSGGWMGSGVSAAAGIVDFFFRPDDLLGGTQITYSVLSQTSSNSSLFSLGTSGVSSSPTKLLPNFGLSNTRYNGNDVSPAPNASTMIDASDRMWTEFGDVGSTAGVLSGTAGNNRYIMANDNASAANYFKSYLQTGNNDVYAADGTTRLYVETLPDTTFTVVMSGATLPSQMRFVFTLWGDQYTWDSTNSIWKETGTKNTVLGFVSLSTTGSEVVPEPSSFVLAGAGLCGAIWAGRRRRA